MEIPEGAVRRIFGERASMYATSAAHTDSQVLAKVVGLATPHPDWSALDVATGTGHTAFALAPHVASVIGIDVTPEMLSEAERLRAGRSLANVGFRLADVHQLPFEDGTFHLITCRLAAHHFSRIDQALREMKRVLRPDGRLVIDDRSVPEDDFVDDCMNALDRYHDESHVREYRPSEWRKLLDGAGLIAEAVEPYVKHRPLTSLTDGVSPENVRRVYALLKRLNASQREVLNLVEMDGQLYINHWYIMLSARKGG